MCHRLQAAAALAAFVAMASGAHAAAPADVPVPARLQAQLFAKILGFDRNLDSRAGRTVVIGVLHQRGYRPSLDAGDEIQAAIAALPAGELTLRVVMLDADAADLDALLDAQSLAVLYVTPLRALEVETVAAAARRRSIRTLTGVPAYVRRGLSIGLGLRDGRPEILVNLEAARAEGANYSSQLLTLVRVVR